MTQQPVSSQQPMPEIVPNATTHPMPQQLNPTPITQCDSTALVMAITMLISVLIGSITSLVRVLVHKP